MKRLSRKKRQFSFGILVLLLFSTSGFVCHLWGDCKAEGNNLENDAIFQYSTIKALMGGLFDGDITIEKLLRCGTIGVGTFNNLDGEMVVLDSEVYKIKVDGNAYHVPESEKTPFSVLSKFKPDFSSILEKPMNFETLQKHLDTLLPSKNIFYAFRIEGKFSYVKTRSVPPQKKPYPPASEIIKKEKEFSFKDVEGFMIGFRFPFYMKDINLPGYHFHFITKDKKRGGHLLECQVSYIKIEIDHIYSFKMILPNSEDFLKMNLQR